MTPTHLGDSYNKAPNRFKSLERRPHANNNLHSEYVKFINEDINLNHMSIVQNVPTDIPIYFRPHHCVQKVDSTSTKLRVVFDGSSASSNGISLNDILMTGPTVQPKFFSILLRFHTFEIALTADICKIYRCIKATPLKTLNIPRLELLTANLLSSDLLVSIKNLNLFSAEYHCWSDSTIVLSWLNDEPSRYNVFVSNRISNIQTNTQGMSWHHVPTKMNPADLLSRGATPHALKQSKLWLNGPQFLAVDQNQWPSMPETLTEAPERRKTVCLSSSKQLDISLNMMYANKFSKMQRIFAYIHRFGSKGVANRKGPPTAVDIKTERILCSE